MLLFDGYIQNVSNKRVIHDFLEKCTKTLNLLSRGVVKVRLLEQKQLKIDTNILHQVDLEFDVETNYRVKNWCVAQIWDTLYGLSRKKLDLT